MDIQIRRARQEDIPEIVRLWRQMWDLHTRLDPRFTTSLIANEVMAKWVEENIQDRNSLVIVAMHQERVVGYCLGMILENPPVVTEPLYGYISEIAVEEAFRRKGIGGTLLKEVHRWFKEKNASYIEVNASIYNQISRSFWRRYGYKEFLERLRYEL